MSHSEHDETIYRTTPRRVGKMLAIIIGIQIIGGLIFFTHYDYWNSYLPEAGKIQEEQMEKSTQTTTTGGAGLPSSTQGQFTGQVHTVSLKFIESPDFKNYGFNAPIGSPGADPEIHVKLGDKIVFHVTNGGKSFHAFAITASPTGPGPAIDGTTIGTADNPMKPGQSGTVTFIPGSAGTYYYICAVPGHRELGMNGKIEVEGPGGASGGPALGTGGTAPANGNKVSYSLAFEISPDFSKYGFNGTGGTGTDPTITVHSGDTVTIHLTNPSKSFHAFGIVTDPNNPSGIVWNANFKTPDNPMKPGESGDVTFVAGTPGLYHYICTVPGHAALGMDGQFIVEK